ncbi:MAG: excisionase family DNA-binding protein [Saprospiraceae bacterium]|nr:excisionase family DNA-binding protein [Candidatus Vicinibacter affinis]MBK8641752.1 excisionase family DNA-binding protein [Candidatus Vicinibacter affinis]
MRSFQSKVYLSIDEAADYLSISKSELYKKTASQSIPFYKVSRKMVRFKITELDQYMAGFKVEPINQ